MATLTTDNLIDLGKSVLKDLGRLKYTDLRPALNNYTAMPSLLAEERITVQGGTGIQRQIALTPSDAAKNVGLYEERNVNISDTMTEITVPWRHTTTAYAYERREVSMNTGKELIFNLIKSRREGAMISLAERMETDFWGKPADSNDKKTPFGIDYWLVKNATLGFNGGNASGFTGGPGGLDASLEANSAWRNFTGSYAEVNKEDLITKMREAYVKTDFVAPISLSSYKRGSDKCVIYVGYETLAAMERIGESQNENLGRDLAPYDGRMTFRQCTIERVSKLDGRSDRPVYMVNWAYFMPVVLSGEWMREEGPMNDADQPSVFRVYVDCTYNTLCVDRRRQAVLHYVAP